MMNILKKTGMLRTFLIVPAAFCFSAAVLGQTLSDMDGNTYRVVKWGKQEWMAENLDVSHFRNGDPIPEARTEEEWSTAFSNGKPAWCYFNNDRENGNRYGKLYNWFAVNDPRGLAPEGWRVPDNGDWRTFIRNLQGVDIAGNRIRSTNGWKSSRGTNDTGFSALPGGYRDDTGKFRDMGKGGWWWSNTSPVEVKQSSLIYSIYLSDSSPDVKYKQQKKGAGISVRCLRD